LRLGVPSSRSDRHLAIGIQRMRQQGDDRIQCQQARCRVLNGLVRPLPLSFKAQMGAAFFKCGLDRPAFDEGDDDVANLIMRTGREVCAWLVLPFGVADKHPAQRQHWLPDPIPHRSAAGEIQDSPAAVVPPYTDTLPGGCRRAEDLCEFRQALPFDTRASVRSRLAEWSRLVQCGIESQRSEQTHIMARAGCPQLKDTIRLIANNRHLYARLMWLSSSGHTETRTIVPRERCVR
jgi:hypothetical protein